MHMWYCVQHVTYMDLILTNVCEKLHVATVLHVGHYHVNNSILAGICIVASEPAWKTLKHGYLSSA